MEEQLGLLPGELRGSHLQEVVAEPPEDVAHYLDTCARNRKMVLGSLVLRSRRGRIHFRCEGAVVQPRSAATEPLLLLRLTPKSSATGQFTALNHKINQLAKEIHLRVQAENQIKEASRRKDEFLATLAHELRNPLAPVRTCLELMRLAPDDRLLIERSRQTMERQIKHMVRLIDDLLDVSRITLGKIRLQKSQIVLSTVVQDAVESAHPLVDEAQHIVSVTIPPEPIHLHADPTRLVQVLSNLLSNAAKYTQREGHIWLAVERQDNEAVIAVRDTGIGIAPEMLDRIFEMFTQVNRSLETSRSGLGVGLALAKRLIEMHDGTIEAKSSGPGQGSEFIVRLPLHTGKKPQLTQADGKA